MYYETQGGGKAEYQNGILRFTEAPPPPMYGLNVGDKVPDEWGVIGPFDEDGRLVEDEYDEYEYMEEYDE